MTDQHLTRSQRRAIERVNNEASDMFNKIMEQFIKYMMDDVTDELIESKRKEASAKWRLYCKTKGLLPKAFPLMDEQSKDIVKSYLEDKK